MARKIYTEEEVLSKLRKKNDCLVRQEGQTKFVLVLNGQGKRQQKLNDLGNGSWGKIDFLINHCGYKQRFVEEF